MQCNIIQYNTKQYNTLQCNAIKRNTMQWNALQYNALQCKALQRHAIRYQVYFNTYTKLPCITYQIQLKHSERDYAPVTFSIAYV